MTKLARIFRVIPLVFVAEFAASAASQTVTFDTIPSQIFGGSPFVVAAEASSGLPVTFTSTTPAVCKTASNLVILLGAGPCFITARQAGNGAYSAASAVRSFTVNQARPSGTLTAAAASPSISNPEFIVSGDFNGDGVPDLATVNTNNSVAILLGDGLGGYTIAAGSPYSGAGTNSSPVLVLGDFNGDGFQDLATIGITNQGESVTVFAGNGSGGFTLLNGITFLGEAETGDAVAVGDFNGDGIQDLVQGNVDGTLTLLIGNGQGQFTRPLSAIRIGGQYPSSIVVGDFNQDGIQDVATANDENGTVSVMLGDGTGYFAAAAGSPFPAGTSPVWLVVGDFNRDGIQDLAVANSGSNDVTVLLGNGSGGFTTAMGSPFNTGTGAGPVVVVTDDFNGDGYPDLAIANYYLSSITLLLGNGSGGFTPASGSPFPVGQNPTRLVVGDFNGDGIPDLASANPSSNNVTVLLGGPVATTSVLSTTLPSSITFGQSVPLTLVVTDVTTPFSPLTGTAMFLDGSVVVGTASQIGSPYTFTVPSPSVGPHTLIAAYSGDGYNLASTSNSVMIQVNPVGTTPQSVTFGPPGDVPLSASPIDLSAIASSGLAVMFASNTPAICAVSGAGVSLLGVGVCSITASQAGGGSYAAAPNVSQSFNVLKGNQTIAFDAIPGQIFGASPIVTAAKASSGLAVSFASSTPSVCRAASVLVTLVGAGTCTIATNQTGNTSYNAAATVTRSFSVTAAGPSGGFAPSPGSPFTVGLVPFRAVIADLNQDGFQDVATANAGDKSISILLGNGAGGFAASPGSPISFNAEPDAIATGDFNGDGIPDLVTATSDNKVTVLLGNGAGGFAQAGVPIPVGSGALSIAVGDFNGDGLQDIATANEFDNDVTILLGNGSGGFTEASGSPFGNIGRYNDPGPISIVVGDFNGDGLEDLAVANETESSIAVLLGNGSGGFTAATGSPFSTGGYSPLSSVVGDFNGDGIPDLATANSGSSNIAVFLGNGSGGFAATAPVSLVNLGPGASPGWLAVGDFNADGLQDLAVADYGGLAVLLGNGLGGFTADGILPGVAGSYPPRFVATGDFNGDGIADLLTANYGGNNVTVLLGGLASSASVLGTTSSLVIPTAQSIPLTLTVSDTTTAYNAPTGTVTFSDGVNVLGMATQSASPYRFTASGLGLGTHVLTAAYGGDAQTAGSVSNSLTIQVEQPQMITFGPLGNVAIGSAPVSLNALASSGYPIVFTSNTPAVCSISGSAVTALISGGCSITASQPGDITYVPAAPVTQTFTVLFSDVSPTDIFYDEINTFAQYGITSGCGNNGFCPDANVTRDEMAIFIVRAIYGNDNFTYTAAPYFSDVTSSTFGFKWIQKLKDLGITSGCTVTTYCPGEVVTRDQMAVLIIRARLGVSIAGPAPTFTYPSTPYFSDATAANEFAFPWIQRMELDSVTNGCTATTYCPTQPVTREEMAVFIMRGAFNLFMPAGTPLLTQVSPSTLAAGTSGSFTITGSNTNFVQGTTQLSPIPGVTIGTITVASPTAMAVQLTAATNAVGQPYSILAITGAEQDVLPNGLVIQ